MELADGELKDDDRLTYAALVACDLSEAGFEGVKFGIQRTAQPEIDPYIEQLFRTIVAGQ